MKPGALAALAGVWAAPPDLPARIALGLAAACALAALVKRGPAFFLHRRTVAIAALGAAMLSVAYISSYLRGGPRIIDATTYFLQGRALAHGDLAWRALEPTASFRGRFLLEHDGMLGGIFPPGYPLLLALGFTLRAPMVIGPLLAGLLVFATHRLGRSLAREVGLEPEPVARIAAVLSVACAALRYHTADTMSHGATALGVTVVLWAALEARRHAGHHALLAGLALGGIVATRPFSALAPGLVAFALLRGHRTRLVLAALPGVLFLVVAQHAVTGSWLASSQRMYYALSDGPPGCFRWGFGAGIGCLNEHGDFVRARLAHGYGLVAALGTTLRRLHMHVLDVANLEPIALLVLVPIVRARRVVAIRAAGTMLALHLLAYAPFYFDGDYPGGGARFLADVLPVEHVLVALAVAQLWPRRLLDAGLGLLAVALAGFAIHASHQHVLLRDRDGGRPMFEPDVLAQAGVTNGLVFVDTDHGFALGHDPAAGSHRDVLVARLRDDDRDRLLYENLDRPTTWRYHREPSGMPRLVPWAPPEHGSALRFEAEAEWPPLAQEGGFASPAWMTTCASKGRVLAITPTGEHARVRIALPVPSTGRWSIEPHVARDTVIPAHGVITIAGATWAWTPDAACQSLPAQEVDLRAPTAELTIDVTGAPLSLDFISIRNVKK